MIIVYDKVHIPFKLTYVGSYGRVVYNTDKMEEKRRNIHCSTGTDIAAAFKLFIM